MAQAKRDENHIPTLLAVSNADGVTPVVLWADPVTHRLLVDLPASGSSLSGLSDVTLTNPQNGQALTYDQASGKWINTAIAGSGTVTSVSVASANGFAGSVANASTTPAITLSTSVTGVLKGNGTAISAAIAGTDYSAGTSALATGILKSTTTTGALTIAVAADFPTLNQNTTGSAATLTTARAIYGNNFDGSAALTQVIASTYGGTGNGFTKFSGPTTSEKTKTVRDASDTILELGGSYTPTGTWTSLTMVTPVLGTPSSGTLTNCTGLPVSSGVSGLGTNVATFLATPSSANLASALTDETGSGAAVFATSPTLVTPNLGKAQLTSGYFSSVVDNGNSGTSKTIDWTQGNKQKITTTGSCTLTFTAPSGPCSLTLKIIHEASSTAYTYTWPSIKWPGGTPATTTNTSGAVDIVTLFYDGSNYYGVGNAAFA